MSEQLERLSVVEAVPAIVLRSLERALSGAGPALAPVETIPEREQPGQVGQPGRIGQILAALGPDEPLEAPGIAVVLPTSGSTGEPKGVLLSAAALAHSATATLERLSGPANDPADRPADRPGQWLLALPVSRIAGLQVLVRTVLSGMPEPITVPVPFTAAGFVAATGRLSADRRYGSLVPTQLARLLDAAQAGASDVLDALRSYDAILVGGAAAHATLLARARAEQLRIVTTYGMTETCGGCVYDGTPLDEVTVDLDHTGRISIGGPVLFSGYRLRPDLTAAALVDGRHVTADLGRIDDDGRLDVLGRTDDVVVSGGVNVPLPAVENSLSAMPSIAEAVVVGVPDAVWGARVVAFVVARPGAEPPTLQQVRVHVSSLHPKAYAPRKLVLLPALPMLESGKVDRSALIGRAR